MVAPLVFLALWGGLPQAASAQSLESRKAASGQTFDNNKQATGGAGAPAAPPGAPPADGPAMQQLQQAAQAGGGTIVQPGYPKVNAVYKPGQKGSEEKKKSFWERLTETRNSLLEPFGGWDERSPLAFTWGGMFGLAAGIVLSMAVPGGLVLGLLGGLLLGLLFNWLK